MAETDSELGQLATSFSRIINTLRKHLIMQWLHF